MQQKPGNNFYPTIPKKEKALSKEQEGTFKEVREEGFKE
jgi:hypothetical protein